MDNLDMDNLDMDNLDMDNLDMDNLEIINQQYTQWQNELSVGEMHLRPFFTIEKNEKQLDLMLEWIGIKEKILHK